MEVIIYPLQSICEIGTRENQEDAIFPAPGQTDSDGRVFVLCDGMGGHEHGELASQTVCAAISKHLNEHWPKDSRVEDRLILDALEASFHALDSTADAETNGMGTTLTLVVLHRGGCTVAHIGDSRIYHIRPKERRMLYRSRDHSLVFELYQAGEISYEEMRTSPRKNIITRAMQPGEDNRVKPDIAHIGDLQPGDYLYMCSDGMMEQMDDEKLLDIFCNNHSDDILREKLILETQDNNDNHSAHIIHIKEVRRARGEHVADDESDTRCNALNLIPALETVDAEEQKEKPADDVVVISPKEPPHQQAHHPSGIRWIWAIVAAVVIVAAAAVMIISNK